MILEKLSKLELEAIKTIAKKKKKIQTIQDIKELLDQIDFDSEVIPLENEKKINELLTSLKGKHLSESEKLLVHEIQIK